MLCLRTESIQQQWLAGNDFSVCFKYLVAHTSKLRFAWDCRSNFPAAGSVLMMRISDV